MHDQRTKRSYFLIEYGICGNFARARHMKILIFGDRFSRKSIDNMEKMCYNSQEY